MATPQQCELLDIYRSLEDEGRGQLLAFAQFLQQRALTKPDSRAVEDSVLEPLVIERPVKESVVAAMRRLAKAYPMLNKDELLHQAAGLMSAHILQGRVAGEVIDDLETLFANAYTTYRATVGAPGCD